MTFRRFDIKINEPGNPKNQTASEVLLNLAQIVRITQDAGDNTWIALADGSLFLSSIEYKYLADALDGYNLNR